MLCGEVERLEAGIATVLIKLMSREVYLTIPARALLNLDFIVRKKREVYYVG